MRLGIIPENLAERLMQGAGIIPTPVADSFVSLLLARTIMAATKLGVFEALRKGPRTADEVADTIGCDRAGTHKLLGAMVGCRYVEVVADRYRLAAVARKWLLADSPTSLRDYVLFRYLEWDMLADVERYVRTGMPLDIHRQTIDTEHWRLYQRGMRSLASLSAHEIAARTPMPPSPQTMLDIGGAHGFNSVCFCRRYPGLRATVLDLPDAVEHASRILAEEGMGVRVRHQVGCALETDLPENTYDFVFISQLVHHFDEATNRSLTRRIAAALRPGGVFAAVEVERPQTPEALGRAGGQLGAFLNFYFAMTSRSGTWSRRDIAGWQSDADLQPLEAIPLRRMPGGIIQAARKRE